MPALPDQDREQLVVAQAHELDLLEDLALRARGHEDHGVAGELGEDLARVAQRGVEIVGVDVVALEELLALLGAHGADLEQGVDEEAQPLIGGHAAGRGVRLLEEAGLLEIAHDVADGRRREVDPGPARDGARADGVARGQVLLHDGGEDLAGTVVEVDDHRSWL